jgi:hypothetical protein
MIRAKIVRRALIVPALLVLVSAAAENHFFLAAGASFLRPADEAYRAVYGNQAIYPELSAAVRVAAGLCLTGSYGRFSRSGTTLELGLPVSSTQSYISWGLGYLLRVSPTLCLEAGGGMASVSFQEEGLDTSVRGRHMGFKAEGGVLLVPEDERIFMGLRVGYVSAKVPGSDLDPAVPQSLRLGGLKISVSIGIQIFGGE